MVVALLLALASTTALVTPAEAAVSTRVLLRATPASPVPGETLALSGTTSPPVIRPVSFQRAEHGRWVTRATGRTNARGAYRMVTRALAAPRVGYRVYLPPTRAGGRTYAAAVSRAAFVRSVPQSGTVTAPTSPVASGAGFTATAAFTPARPGRWTWLEARTGSTWTRVSPLVRQSSTGRATLAGRTIAAGTMTYRAVAGALSGAPAVGTPTRTVVVSPPAGRNVDGSSTDGRFTVFRTQAALVPTDTNDWWDVYLLDRDTGNYALVSHGPDGEASNGFTFYSRISADGRWVVFSSEATNLVPGDDNGVEDVFLFERETGAITAVSHFSTPDPEYASDPLFDTNPSISGDGAKIAFRCRDDDTTRRSGQIVVWKRATGQSSLASTDAAGTPPNAWSADGVLSEDGTHLAFTALSTANEDEPTWSLPRSSGPNVFVRDLTTGETVLVSDEVAGGYGDANHAYDLSADGRYIAYMHDVYLPDAGQDASTVAWRDLTQPGSVHPPGTVTAQRQNSAPSISADGQTVTLRSGQQWSPDDTNDHDDTYRWFPATGATELVP